MQKRLLLFFKGMAMGAADTVPGVSGGTIAFITNIYEELILSIQACNLQALNILHKQGVKAAWLHINGGFLLTLFLGIVSAALLLANTVSFLLESFELHVMAFFVGLILASALYLRKEIKVWDAQTIILLVAGLGLAVCINFLPQSEQQTAAWFVFVSGAIAICAMILPGISGAFILVLLGSYETVLQAVINFNIKLILVFMAGCLLGLIAFSNVLAYLLKHYHTQTMAFLLGILLGSLYGLWPEGISVGANSVLVWTQYSLLIMIGFSIVYTLELITGKNN